MSELVSVIVPVYGVGRYLRQCLDSVVGQTYGDLDVIVVDDGSLDAGGAICDEYAARDKRVRAYHTENRGLSAARNYGIARARGEYILLLDGDDWIEGSAVGVLVDAARAARADMVCCRRVVEWATGPEAPASADGTVVLEGDAVLRGLLVGGRVSDQAWDKLYRAELFEGVSYPEGHVFEDISTTYRLVMRAGRVACVPDALYHYRVREESISKQHSAENLIDYWSSYLQRYVELSGDADQYRRACVRGCLGAISRTWCWWMTCSRTQREAYRGVSL